MSHTTRIHAVLGGITAAVLLAGIGVASGVVPELSSEPAVESALELEGVGAPTSDLAGPAVADPTTTEAPTATEAAPATTAAPTTVAPTTVPPTTLPPTTVPRTTVPPTTLPPTTLPPVTPPPVTVPALAPRVVPSGAQVQDAIKGITSLVSLPFFFQLTPAYVADFGDQVCDSFDAGQTFTQVKAEGLAAVAQLVTVTPAAADYAVKTAVSMYCPAYQSRLA